MSQQTDDQPALDRGIEAHYDPRALPEEDRLRPTSADEEAEVEEDEKAPAPGSSLVWRRIRNIFIITFLLWLATIVLRATTAKPKVVHAHRYTLSFLPVCFLSILIWG